MEPDCDELGSVSGMLEQITTHGKRSNFTLYTAYSGETVKCFFEESSLNRVRDALDRYVTVYGLLTYARNKTFPIRVLMNLKYTQMTMVFRTC